MRILVVEDDIVMGNLIRQRLMADGFVADMAHDGLRAEEMAAAGVHDAVVLDLGLPGRSGLDLLRQWRRQGDLTPVIILSARGSWQEKIEGIEAGADDYLGKPFQMAELAARVKALIRRSHGTQGGLARDGFTLDESGQCVGLPGGESVQLTATEFRLLRCFMLNPGRILSKEALMDHIYDFDTVNDHNVIEVHVNHLRKKLGRETIRTLRGQGYRWAGRGGEPA